jgi:PTS system nitrogen regulatory IIA component
MADFPYLRPECVETRREAADKDAVLGEIARLAKESPLLSAYTEKQVFDALKEREEQSSTGLENGLAIPHCRLDDVPDFVVGVLLLEVGVDFGALDGSNSRAFVFIIGPTAERDLHIRILSAISRGLVQPGALDALLSAGGVDELLEVFRKRISLTEVERPKEHSLITVFIQSEDAFESIAELFSNPIYGNAMIVDAANAGRSLRSLPLFSAFWTDRQEDFGKIIAAVVPKAMSNEIIRKINLASGEGAPGVLIAVQELSFVSGSLSL